MRFSLIFKCRLCSFQWFGPWMAAVLKEGDTPMDVLARNLREPQFHRCNESELGVADTVGMRME